MITCLAGGVGAAKFLVGLSQVVDPDTISVIVNTGDDFEMFGLYICPDMDSVTYHLAGVSNNELGWGRAQETWAVMGAIASLQGPDWFMLGDLDIATHLVRTEMIRSKIPLSEISKVLSKRFGIAPTIVPMSDDPVRTMVRLEAGHDSSTKTRVVSFQEYFVKLKHSVSIHSVWFDGSPLAKPVPGAIEFLEVSKQIVICPSNPVVSIGPILSVAGYREVLTQKRDQVVAVSPIVGGKAIKGPADRMLTELGHESSSLGVARLYQDFCGTLVIDTLDQDLQGEIENLDMKCVVANTIMDTPKKTHELADLVMKLGKTQ